MNDRVKFIPPKKVSSKQPILKPTVHVETTNMSFLQTASDLKRLGISNNKFFLKLYDPTLKYVDPYDEKRLSPELIERIIGECIINPWYFKREIARIPDAGGNGVRYELNRGNLAASWCFHENIDHYLVLPRQIGKTQGEISDILWAFLFGTTNTEFSFGSLDGDAAILNLDRLKAQRELLPSYLQFKVVVGEDNKAATGRENVKTLSTPKRLTNNRIVTKASANSREKADKIGRGSTQTIQMLDEADFTPYIDIILAAMGPAYANAARAAKKNRAAHCRILTSTPGDIDSSAGAAALRIINRTVRWSEEFYDWDRERLDRFIEINSENGIVYIEYQYTELGKDEAWFIDTCRKVDNDPLKIRREILLHRMRGSDLSPYEAVDLEEIQEKIRPIVREIYINKFFRLDVYEEIKPEIGYIIGVDVASGVNRDNSAIIILNPHTCRPVAEFKSSLISIPQFKEFLRSLIIQVVPRGLLCIERNNQGISLITLLQETDISSRLYHDIDKVHKESIVRRTDADGWLKQQASIRSMYGIWTGTDSRETMFSILETHILEHKDRFVCKELVNEIFQLVRTKTGKIEAGPGFNDDLVMAYNIAMYVYYYGKNLHKFGISKANLELGTDRPEEKTRDEIDEVYRLLEEEGIEMPRMAEKSYDEIFNMEERNRLIAMRHLLREQNEKEGYAESLDEYSYAKKSTGEGFDDDFFDSLNHRPGFDINNNW